VLSFFLDEDQSDETAKLARSQGLDAISSHEIGRNSIDDEEQLRWAAEQGRCLVTRDDDFVRLTYRFLENHWPHAGVLLVPRSLSNSDFSGIAAALVAYAEQYPDGLPSYMVDYLRPVGRP
jgi:predicted nuclease of predicted toxin-antitoxin system